MDYTRNSPGAGRLDIRGPTSIPKPLQSPLNNVKTLLYALINLSIIMNNINGIGTDTFKEMLFGDIHFNDVRHVFSQFYARL